MLQVNLSAVKKRYELCAWDWEQKWQALLTQLNKSKATKKMFPLESILDASGLDNAVIALGAVKGHKRAIRLFACYCARKAVPLFEKRYPSDMRLSTAIGVAEQYARGLATKENLDAARKTVRDVYKDVCADKVITTSQFQLEELYTVFNTVATCVNAKWFVYTATRYLDLEQVSLMLGDCTSAIYNFIKDVITKEDKERNAALNDDDPLEACFKSFRSVPALEPVAENVMKAAAAAIEVIAKDTVSNLEKNSISIPLTEAKIAAWFAIWNTVCGAAVHGISSIIIGAVEEELTVEFRRFCRLEGEYGEAEAKEKNCRA